MEVLAGAAPKTLIRSIYNRFPTLFRPRDTSRVRTEICSTDFFLTAM